MTMHCARSARAHSRRSPFTSTSKRKRRDMWKSFAVVLLIAACGQRAEQSPAPAVTTPSPSSRATTLAPAAPASAIAVTTNDGQRVVDVTSSGGNVTVNYEGGVLHGRRKGDKRKYESVEVKYGDEGGFKVRTLDGKLLW